MNTHFYWERLDLIEKIASLHMVGPYRGTKEKKSKKVHFPLNVFEKFAYMVVEIRKNCSA